MKTQLQPVAAAAIIALAFLGFSGCISKVDKATTPEEHHEGDGHEHHEGDGHDHGDHDHKHVSEADVKQPADFNEAVTRIKAGHEQVQAALAEGDVHKAHPPADELYILSGKLMALARDSGVPKAQWKQVNQLTKDLEKQLEALHDAIDRDEPKGYESIQTAIKTAVDELETIAQSVRTAARP